MRSAIFDRLQLEVRDARVLDLCAGSGALAIEALSRGAAHATLVERQRGLAQFLGRQLEALSLSPRARVVEADASRFLTGEHREAAAGPYDLVLLDPPYAELELYPRVLDALVTHGHLADDAIVVIEYQKRRGRPPEIGRPAGLSSEAIREHGQTALEFFRHTGQASSP